MTKQSAGILLYRATPGGYEVLIVHPGGPFWAKKDTGAWSIPKGEFGADEDPLAAAKREFTEELGGPPPDGHYEALEPVKQPSGKVVHAFALKANFDLEQFKSTMFEMEWPPRSGKKQEFPECDKAAWVSLPTAAQKLVKGQVAILQSLASVLQVAPFGTEPPLTPERPGQTSLF